jgi:tetratricopeptide (TPR) repeat protein
MSETNSLNKPELTTDGARPRDSDTPPLPDAAGHALFERIGVGGMGEVYRCGDGALQRDLAIKVIKAQLRGDHDAEERFLREARLTGSLQHPGVVPVHNLSRLADNRLCYTMKLVRGRTLADLLRDEPNGPERLPRLLAVVEKVCQAVAYAHSKGVLHRDLKPSNVMVGEFGEVQVMDWGLAKELARAEPVTPSGEATQEVETVGRVEEAAGLSRAGAALGTPSYMPPEQAAGDWDIVDERADVFALGAILCEVLTGRPPYHGASRDELLRKARRGDMVEALGRLEQCGADAALVQLCRECLAPEREGRPRHAGRLAERLAAYLADVQARLRRAELERAEAQVQTREERKRRRLTAALAALVLLLLVLGGGGIWWQQRQRDKADQAVSNGLAQAELLAEQARADPLQTDKYHQALEAARVAAQLVENASTDLRQMAEALISRLQQEEEAARKDRQLLAALLDVRGPREGPRYQSDAKGAKMALEEPTADEQFASAFRRWGLDVDGTAPSEVAAMLKARPAVVVTEVVAALDEWASERRQQAKPKAEWQRLDDLAAALDDDPGSLRRELRAILARGQLPVERALSVLSAALRPVSVPAAVPWGRDCTRLRQLAERVDPAVEPVLGLLTLARALRAAGEEALAERLLRAASDARPHEVVLYHTLGQLLTGQEPPRWAEAVEYYKAARARRPDVGVNLATALLRSGREGEGMDLLAWLVKERPGNPYLHFQQANALHGKGDLDGAIACYQQALALDPNDAQAHLGLGNVLYDMGDLNGAIACFKKALQLAPKYAQAHISLGAILCDHKRDYDRAIACFRQALALDPNDTKAHHNLGVALANRGDLDGAIACFKKSLGLDPKLVQAHNSLGNAQKAKGDLDGAIACYRKAIELNPKHGLVHYNLGNSLKDKGDLDGAIACFKKALELDPKYAYAHTNLGLALKDKGDLDGAIACYKKALGLDPKLAHAWGGLGQALLVQGRYAEARDATRRALALLPAGHPLKRPAAQQLQSCEQWLVLDGKLPDILRGETSPASPGEALILAQMCQQHKRRHVAAGRLYADAFAAEPKLAADQDQQYRYHAACSAALAAAGEGEDARGLPDKVVTMFRHWALGWLRDDLTAYANLDGQNHPAVKQPIQQRLTHWKRDADLASVRDPQALDRLPEDERAAWRALWRDVDKLTKRAEPTRGRKEPQAPKAKP